MELKGCRLGEERSSVKRAVKVCETRAGEGAENVTPNDTEVWEKKKM